MQRLIRSALVLALLFVSPLARGDEERWYVLLMQDHRAGWMVERERTEGDRVISESETHMTLRRDQTSLSLAFETRFVETGQGEPVEMWARSDFGGAPTEEKSVFGPDGVTWTQTQNGVSQTKTLPSPEGPWLPPAAAERYVAARLKAGADHIVVRSMDPSNGVSLITTTWSGFEKATIEVMGRTVESLRCTSASSVAPGMDSTEYVDEQGRLLRSEMQVGAWTLTVVAADEQLARSPIDPPELMKSMFVRPDRPIAHPYGARNASFVLSVEDGTMPDLPSEGAQTVERTDEQTVRVTRTTGTPPPLAEPLTPGEFTGSTTMLTCDDARVEQLAKAALTAAPEDPAKRAEILRRFVHRYIRTKDLSVGFGSAAEVARTREGDCTEHAVLLAALLRADGIPSRVASGLIYLDHDGDGMFGYHMWAQACLTIDGKPRWIDLDGTLPDGLPVTAVHIALSVSGLPDDDRMNALVELAPLMGRLRIRVESVE